MRLEGKKALVTGASRGIGHAIATLFAKEGADLALTARSMELLRPLATELQAMGRNVHCMEWDVMDTSQVDARLAEARDVLGGLDILVNNASVLNVPEGHPAPTAEALYDYIMDINLKALYLLSEGAVTLMRPQQSGVIINMASDAGMRGASHPYGISKWGVVGYTRGLSQRVAKDGIRVNSVAPGPVATRLMGCEDGTPKEWPDGPLGRYTYPEEVATVVLFLATDDAMAVHGQAIVLNTANS